MYYITRSLRVSHPFSKWLIFQYFCSLHRANWVRACYSMLFLLFVKIFWFRSIYARTPTHFVHEMFGWHFNICKCMQTLQRLPTKFNRIGTYIVAQTKFSRSMLWIRMNHQGIQYRVRFSIQVSCDTICACIRSASNCVAKAKGNWIDFG